MNELNKQYEPIKRQLCDQTRVNEVWLKAPPSGRTIRQVLVLGALTPDIPVTLPTRFCSFCSCIVSDLK